MNFNLVDYNSLEEAADGIFDLLKEYIGINTFFIAQNDGQTVDILKVLNQDYPLLEEGFQIDFQKSY